jgi:anti-sigma B factor antagonist
MKIAHDGETLVVSQLPELSAGNSDAFRRAMCMALPPALKVIEVDLSETRFVDSCGLGALMGVHKTATRMNSGVLVRLVNPPGPIQQLVELTRLHHVFDVVQR